MDFHSLRAYVTVCEEKKMSCAADKLFMSKQALSTMIKKMEAEMNAVFLRRTNAGVELTQEGQCFYGYAVRMLEQWTQCREEIDQMGRVQRMRLRVGFAYMSINLWTEEVAELFARENRDIELSVEVDLSKNLLRLLDEGQIDAVVTCMQQEQYDKYDKEMLMCPGFSVMMKDDDPLATKDALTVEDLRGRRILYPDSGAEYLRRFEQFMAQEGIPIQTGLLKAGNFLANLKVIRDENALKLTNSLYRTVTPHIDGYVFRDLVDSRGGRMPKITLYALLRPSMRESAAALRFVTFFKGQIN